MSDHPIIGGIGTVPLHVAHAGRPIGTARWPRPRSHFRWAAGRISTSTWSAASPLERIARNGVAQVSFTRRAFQPTGSANVTSRRLGRLGCGTATNATAQRRARGLSQVHR